MGKRRRIDVRGILADPDLRRRLMVATLQATQAREGIETTREQAERAYYVVTEAERVAFFDLERFRGGKGKADRRRETFLRTLAGGIEEVRFDVARRDFAAIEDAPLAYRHVGLVSHLFREAPTLDPGWAQARRGAYTGDDLRYVRYWWEPLTPSPSMAFTWERFAKGGEYSRFYSDVDLVVRWDPRRRTFAEFHGRKGRETERPESLDEFFRPGLTWPRRTQRGFNVRVLPEGCVFADKGPGIFPTHPEERFFILGVVNAACAEFILQGLTSFGSWEVGAVKRLPVPLPTRQVRDRIGESAEAIYDAKASWDEGNEVSTRFRAPWLLRDDLVGSIAPLSARLKQLSEHEAREQSRIQKLYSELNDVVYKLYGIPDRTRAVIERTLGERPPEILWPQMERCSLEQKQMEHVFRLLSFVAQHIVRSDEDGVVPFTSVGDEPALLERVNLELQSLFPALDATRVEVEIANELKKQVTGYRRTAGIAEWLEKAFFEYHSALYQSRPIVWHLASSQGTGHCAFAALVDYHRFDRQRMATLRARYVRDVIESFRREAALAGKESRADHRLDLQARLEETEEFDRRLQWVQEGHHEGAEGGDKDFRIATPWKPREKRPQGWQPDFDDGVRVNIEPLEKAHVLRIAKV